MCSERQIINYVAPELEIMRLNKQNIVNEIKILNVAKRCVVYPNQETIANEVVKAFKDRSIINMLLAKTQAGKTGSTCAMIEK